MCQLQAATKLMRLEQLPHTGHSYNIINSPGEQVYNQALESCWEYLTPVKPVEHVPLGKMLEIPDASRSIDA